MASDLNRIVATLTELAKSLESVETATTTPSDSEPISTKTDHANKPGLDPNRLTVARAWAHAIARRDAVFGQDLFFDPAWNMLLELYIASCQNCHISVSSVCIASKAAPTTALRWLTTLERKGLVRRASDPFDKRRSYILLTDEGIQKTEAALDKAVESDRRLGLGRLALIH